jgi:hypothetical protein
MAIYGVTSRRDDFLPEAVQPALSWSHNPIILAYVDLFAIMAANRAHQGIWSSPGFLVTGKTIQDGPFGFDDHRRFLCTKASTRKQSIVVWAGSMARTYCIYIIYHIDNMKLP